VHSQLGYIKNLFEQYFGIKNEGQDSKLVWGAGRKHLWEGRE
jgi:hypothetical protein